MIGRPDECFLLVISFMLIVLIFMQDYRCNTNTRMS